MGTMEAAVPWMRCRDGVRSAHTRLQSCHTCEVFCRNTHVDGETGHAKTARPVAEQENWSAPV